MIKVMERGKNPTMRHAGRTRRVSIAWLHERFKQAWLHLMYEDINKQAADVFIKAFIDAEKWFKVCLLINHVIPERFWGASWGQHGPQDRQDEPQEAPRWPT